MSDVVTDFNVMYVSDVESDRLCIWLQEIDSAIETFSQDPRLSNTDSVFVIIMSHGKLGFILGVDWTERNQAELAEFPIDNIYTHLNTANCPALRDKPKVIIIQACRGGSALFAI